MHSPYPNILTSRGAIAHHTTLNKFGDNPAVGTVEEAIWSTGGAYTGFIPAPLPVRVKVGGNAADTVDGAGARTIRVVGLDHNLNDASEDITLAGTSASVESTTTFCRVFRAFVLTVGTYGGSNTGDIVIETNTGVTMGSILASQSQTEIGVFTIPTGKTGYLVRLQWFVPDTILVVCRLKTREDTDVVSGNSMRAFRTRFVADMIRPGASVDMGYAPIVLPEHTDVLCTGAAASSTHEVSVTFDIILVDD